MYPKQHSRFLVSDWARNSAKSAGSQVIFVEFPPLVAFELWHDRAVPHFLTEAA